MAKYEVIEQVVPKVQLVSFGRSKYLYVRVYDDLTRNYVNRSTGKEGVPEARQWVMENLAQLFQQKATPRGGGNTSIVRLLATHLDYHQRRRDADEISDSTFVAYNALARHFIRWFPDNGYKRLTDIKRTSLQEYAINRVNNDGMAPKSVNQEVMFIRMWWSWMQSKEILNRPIEIPKIRQRVGSRASTAPFEKGHLKLLLENIGEFANDETRKTSLYNRKVFQCFINLLEQSGCRTHEVLELTWNDVNVGETRDDERMIITTLSVPMDTKRGRRQCVFRGSALVDLKSIQQSMVVDPQKSDYLFRNQQTNTLIDRSTFSRYWSSIRKKLGMEQYVFHTFRAHRITQLIMAGVEVELIGRNLGVSPSEIYDTYLRFAPADHYSKLVQKEVEADPELNVMFNRLNAPVYHRKMN